MASSAARKSIVNVKDRKNEIFVDILEKVNVVFSGNVRSKQTKNTQQTNYICIG